LRYFCIFHKKSDLAGFLIKFLGFYIFQNREWMNGLNILREQIMYWLDNTSDKTIEIIQLFYDGMTYI